MKYRLLVPIVLAALMLIGFLTGMIPVGFGSLVALPVLALGYTVLSLLRSLWAAFRWSVGGMLDGLLGVFLGLLVFFSTISLAKDTGFSAFVHEKFPVTNVCSVPHPDLSGIKPDTSGISNAKQVVIDDLHSFQFHLPGR